MFSVAVHYSARDCSDRISELNMATMATTSHGLSVYVNSCIKNPLGSRTRESANYAEGRTTHPRLAVTDPGPLMDSRDDFYEEMQGGLGSSLPVRASFEDVETQLKNLTDEQFYLKLQQLKEANRKTLDECEKLYKEKYGGDDAEMGSVAAREIVENMFAARLAARSGLVGVGATVSQENGDMSDARARSMSAKPPPVPTGKRESHLMKTAPVRSSAYPSHSTVTRARPTSAPSYGLPPRRSYSLDDEEWRKAMQTSSDVSDDEVRSEGPLDPELLSAISKIRDMWRGFRIDDYAPGERRHSSASMANKKKKEHDIADKWRHRITIPKPFHMSMREATKMKKKTKAQQELEEQRLEKLRQEEEECQKKFKAQPAPAHIYLPLYDEIKEKNEARRRYVKQYCKELLKSQEKPFNFVKREEEKKQQRVQSATVAERIARSAERARSQEQKFVAHPVPDFVLDSGPRERLLEEEEYRKIRIKMRARELLKQASLPPNMAANQKLKEQREKEKLMKSKQKSHSKRHQRASHRVPDYDFMYREFQKELARRKQTREATVVEPFSLETNNLRSSREKVLRDMERDEQLMRDTARATPRINLGMAWS